SVGQRTGLMSSGTYKIRNLRTEVTGVVTNTTPTSAYRGAGRPEAAYLAERLVDRIAAELDLDPVAVRKVNFIQPEDFPYRSATGALYDSGNYAETLDTALEMLGWERALAAQKEAR